MMYVYTVCNIWINCVNFKANTRSILEALRFKQLMLQICSVRLYKQQTDHLVSLWSRLLALTLVDGESQTVRPLARHRRRTQSTMRFSPGAADVSSLQSGFPGRLWICGISLLLDIFGWGDLQPCTPRRLGTLACPEQTAAGAAEEALPWPAVTLKFTLRAFWPKMVWSWQKGCVWIRGMREMQGFVDWVQAQCDVDMYGSVFHSLKSTAFACSFQKWMCSCANVPCCIRMYLVQMAFCLDGFMKSIKQTSTWETQIAPW